MLSSAIQNALNGQINAEIYSSYLYAAMSAHFEAAGLKGMAKWMAIQAREEMYHALKFYNFVLERGGRIKLASVEAPPAEWPTPLAVFQDVVVHERKVTAMINNLVNMAKAESDHATDIFLQWFVTEQVEEEASAETVVQKLKLIGEGGAGLFMLDNELGVRVLTPLVAGALTGTTPA